MVYIRESPGIIARLTLKHNKIFIIFARIFLKIFFVP